MIEKLGHLSIPHLLTILENNQNHLLTKLKKDTKELKVTMPNRERNIFLNPFVH
jgi:hypothetical protein